MRGERESAAKVTIAYYEHNRCTNRSSHLQDEMLCAICRMQSDLTWVATENEDLAISSEVVQDDGLELLVAIPDKQPVRAGASLSWKSG